MPVQNVTKSFGPLAKFQVRRAGNVFKCRAELEQNNGVRAEFRAE